MDFGTALTITWVRVSTGLFVFPRLVETVVTSFVTGCDSSLTEEA